MQTNATGPMQAEVTGRFKLLVLVYAFANNNLAFAAIAAAAAITLLVLG